MLKSTRILHASFGSKSHAVSAETPKEGLACSSSYHPAALLLLSAPCTSTRGGSSHNLAGRREHPVHPHHITKLGNGGNMAGASRRRLTVFYIARKFALALYPSTKPLLAKKALARQAQRPLFSCDVQSLTLLKYRINNRLQWGITSKFPALSPPTRIN